MSSKELPSNQEGQDNVFLKYYQKILDESSIRPFAILLLFKNPKFKEALDQDISQSIPSNIVEEYLNNLN